MLEHPHILGLGPAVARVGPDVEANALALSQHCPTACQRGDVHEHIGIAILANDKPKLRNYSGGNRDA